LLCFKANFAGIAIPKIKIIATRYRILTVANTCLKLDLNLEENMQNSKMRNPSNSGIELSGNPLKTPEVFPGVMRKTAMRKK
jgi:hypothetical protein